MDARTGTSEAPLPVLSPCVTPTHDTGRSQSQRGDHAPGLTRSACSLIGAVAALVVRHDGNRARATVSTTTARMPAPRTDQFTQTPGVGSATRAVPSGKSGLSPMAVITIRMLAAAVIPQVRVNFRRE